MTVDSDDGSFCRLCCVFVLVLVTIRGQGDAYCKHEAYI